MLLVAGEAKPLADKDDYLRHKEVEDDADWPLDDHVRFHGSKLKRLADGIAPPLQQVISFILAERD